MIIAVSLYFSLIHYFLF